MKIKDTKWKILHNEVGMKPKFRVFCQDCFWAYVEFRLREMLEVDDYDNVYEYVEDSGFLEAFGDAMLKMLAGHFDMVLRECFCSPLPTIGPDAFHNDMHYKCAKSYGCDRVKVFGVPINEEYYNQLMFHRKGQQRIQPREDWNKDPDLKSQLEGLGYI